VPTQELASAKPAPKAAPPLVAGVGSPGAQLGQRPPDADISTAAPPGSPPTGKEGPALGTAGVATKPGVAGDTGGANPGPAQAKKATKKKPPAAKHPPKHKR
jgi:hypothetical protein